MESEQVLVLILIIIGVVLLLANMNIVENYQGMYNIEHRGHNYENIVTEHEVEPKCNLHSQKVKYFPHDDERDRIDMASIFYSS